MVVETGCFCLRNLSPHHHGESKSCICYQIYFHDIDAFTLCELYFRKILQKRVPLPMNLVLCSGRHLIISSPQTRTLWKLFQFLRFYFNAVRYCLIYTTFNWEAILLIRNPILISRVNLYTANMVICSHISIVLLWVIPSLWLPPHIYKVLIYPLKFHLTKEVKLPTNEMIPVMFCF